MRRPHPSRASIGRLYLSEPKAPLGDRASGLALTLGMRFRIETNPIGDDRWEIQTIAYSYLLFRDDREFVAYHWDHEGISTGVVRTPHMHLGKELPHSSMAPADRERLHELAALHLPTGTIAFTSVLRAVVRDFEVTPLQFQGERQEDARVNAERRFIEAEAAVVASFDWWHRQISSRS